MSIPELCFGDDEELLKLFDALAGLAVQIPGLLGRNQALLRVALHEVHLREHRQRVGLALQVLLLREDFLSLLGHRYGPVVLSACGVRMAARQAGVGVTPPVAALPEDVPGLRGRLHGLAEFFQADIDIAQRVQHEGMLLLVANIFAQGHCVFAPIQCPGVRLLREVDLRDGMDHVGLELSVGGGPLREPLDGVEASLRRSQCLRLVVLRQLDLDHEAQRRHLPCLICPALKAPCGVLDQLVSFLDVLQLQMRPDDRAQRCGLPTLAIAQLLEHLQRSLGELECLIWLLVRQLPLAEAP
mmetsp:Transcript_64898/g.163519  ORF Transcript_64898/g.163519 Transcript_64898/m.163519 type:complete len:299 (+) Transcript_64898:1229-2125(+)